VEAPAFMPGRMFTEGVIDRVQLYEQAVVLALVPFKHAARSRGIQL
jgi:non-canonical (house-cleaning) NTP pyrophosphatase